MRSALVFALTASVVLLSVQPGGAEDTRPRSLAMGDLAWPEIRQAVKAGYTTVIVPSGGTEQNGPHMPLAKHDIIVGHAAEEIARALGHTLVAPVLPIVPEGDPDAPDGNLLFPGTLSLSEATFEAVLEDVARSLRHSGFKTILLIGDHGQSQAAQTRTAARLSAAWSREGIRVIQVDAYYLDADQNKALLAAGETPDTIGVHAGLIDTSELMSIRPDAVRLDALKRIGLFGQSGASGTPQKATPELGKRLLDMRIKAAVRQIRSEPPPTR